MGNKNKGGAHLDPGPLRARYFLPDEDRIVVVVVDLAGNKGKSRFCKHVLLEHQAMLGKAACGNSVCGDVLVANTFQVAVLFVVHV